MTPSSIATGILDVCWPINTVSNWFTAAEEHWERPKPLVSAEYLLEIVYFTHIVRAAVWFSFLVQVFNSCLICCSQENVKP